MKKSTYNSTKTPCPEPIGEGRPEDEEDMRVAVERLAHSAERVPLEELIQELDLD